MTSKSIIQIANINNASAALSQVQHASAKELGGDQVTLVLRLIDATPSMSDYVDEMIQAAQYNVDALLESDCSEEMLMSTWTFNTNGVNVLDGFVKLEDVTPLSSQNYRLGGYTNIYDTVYAALTDAQSSVLEYANTLRKSGIRVKSTIVILTDGVDNESKTSPSKIKAITKQDERTYFCLMAFGTGFAQNTAAEMGFPNVREHNATKGELRKMMGEFSKAQVRASQSTVAANKFF